MGKFLGIMCVSLPASTCDILVSNKGHSCIHISQIPHTGKIRYIFR
jgi:hypothetical protein